MLKYEYNCFNMVFVQQNQGRTTSIPTLDAQSLEGFYAISTLGRCVFVKNQPKNPGWTFITFPCLILNFASQSRTLSTDTTRGVKEAWPRAAASEYFFFFSSSAEERMAVTAHCEWDRASVYATSTSNNATVWG